MKRTVTAAIAGVALAGLIGAGVASAADGTGPGSRLAEVLSGLVGEGTITQQQADAIEGAVTDAHEEARAEREAHRAERAEQIDALVQETLGMDMDALREQLRAGKSLPEIAGDNADDLAAGMTELLSQDLDEAVADGRITREQADEALARAEGRVEAWLSGEQGGRGGLGLLLGRSGDRGGPGHGGPGHGGHGRGGMGAGEGVGPQGPGDSAAATSAVWQA